MGQCVLCWGLVVVSAVVSIAVRAEDADRVGANSTYRCPGPPVRYTNDVSPEDAKSLGCRVVGGAPITVIRGSAFAGPRARAGESAEAQRKRVVEDAMSDADVKRRLPPVDQRTPEQQRKADLDRANDCIKNFQALIDNQREIGAVSGYVDKYVMYTAGMQIVQCRKDAAASACKGAKCGN